MEKEVPAKGIQGMSLQKLIHLIIERDVREINQISLAPKSIPKLIYRGDRVEFKLVFNK